MPAPTVHRSTNATTNRALNTVDATADATLTEYVDVVRANAAGGDIALTLHAAGVLAHEVLVVKTDSSAHTVTVGGLATLRGQYDVQRVVSDGAAWRVAGAAGNAALALSPTYGGAGSYQPVAADLNLTAGAGRNDVDGTSFLAAMMGNVLGALLTKTANYIAGVIGAYSVTGAKGTSYPTGGVLGIISDGVTEADGAVVAVLDGDSAQTKAGAAFAIRNNNSVPGSGFDYGLDLRVPARDGYPQLNPLVGAIRFPDASVQTVAGAPVSDMTAALALWKTLRERGGQILPASVNGSNVALLSSFVAVSALGVGAGIFYLDPADFAVSGRTTGFRIIAAGYVNNVAPAVTMTCSLYAVSAVAGGTGGTTLTLGAQVAGSTVAVPTLAANGMYHAESAEFSLTANHYVLVVDLSGAPAANSSTYIRLTLQARATA